MTIEPLDAADYETARTILNGWITTSTALFFDEPLDTAAFAILVTYDDPRHAAFAIRVADATLAGFALLSPYKARCAHRDTAEVSVYLRPDDVGKGLGQAGLAHIEQHARGKGLHALIGAICAENTASLAAFHRAGYAEVGRFREVGWKFGRRLDVVYVEKLLGEVASGT